MAQGLKDLGHDVRLIGKVDKSGSWPGFNLYGAGMLGGFLQTPGFAAAGLAAAAIDRPDLIISTHVNFGPAARLAKKLFGVPYSLVAHGIDVNQGLPGRTLIAIREADRVIAVSRWTRDRVLDLGGIDPTDLAILPNTIDESRFTVGQKSRTLIERFGIRQDEKILLTVARLDHRERYKGYDRIIEALPEIQRKCGPVRFIIVGAGQDRTRVAALAISHGLESSVSFAGFVAPEELADHYRLADAFAMPSTGEGFGIVFLEALACGTPVVAGNRDGSADALDDGRLGVLIDPTSVAAIAGGITSLLCHEGPALWFDRQALHNAASERFGRKAFLEQLEASILS